MDVMNERIRDLRNGILHMERAEFSEKTGIPPERLEKLEKGKVRVKLADISAISDAFDISTDFLLGNRRLPAPVIRNEKDARIWGMLEMLSDEQLRELMNHLADELDIPMADDAE